MEEKELLEKINYLNLEDEEKRNRVVCSLIGHSKIISTCFGYIYCARCGDHIGDALASIYDASDKVIMGHKCETCVSNYKKLTWKDKIFCPDPFTE